MKKENLGIPKPNLRKVASNKSTRFMLPSINLSSDKTKLKMLEYYGFVNCYIEHKQTHFYSPNYLYLLFNPNSEALKSYNKFHEIYKTYPNYIRDYIVDFNLIMVIFKVKSKWQSAYEQFKRSNYSSMGKDYSELFKHLDIQSGKVTILQQNLIITRHEEYRKHLEESLDTQISKSAELMSPIDNLEYLDYIIS